MYVNEGKDDVSNRLLFRAEKEKLSERLEEDPWQEEVDDSGFYAGELPLCCSVGCPSAAVVSDRPRLQVDPSHRWA